LRRGIARPFKLLALSPLGGLLAFYMAMIYGFLYLMITSISQVFVSTYGFSSNVSGLAYISLGLGCLSGNLLVSLTSDRYMLRRSAQNDKERKPEYRNFWVPWGAVSMPCGLFLYGWSAEYRTHWIVPMVGLYFVGLGFNTIFNSLLLYIVECFTIFAASALAANGIIRNLGGGLLPLAGLTLYGNLGIGWGNSVLAFVHLGVVIPMTVILVRYGETLRKTYALKDL
jgi:MFS family permease